MFLSDSLFSVGTCFFSNTTHTLNCLVIPTLTRNKQTKKKKRMYVCVFGFHVVVTPPTFRHTTLTRQSPPPSPHVSMWQPPCRHRWIHGCRLSISSGRGGQKSLHCTCHTPPPLRDWFMTELSSLLSLSLSSLALCDGGDPCKWSWCTVPKFPQRHIERAALHSDCCCCCCCVPFPIGCLSLTSSTCASEIDPAWNKKKALLCYLSSFLSFLLHKLMAVKQSVFILIEWCYFCWFFRVCGGRGLYSSPLLFFPPFFFGVNVFVWLPRRRRRLRWPVFRVRLRRRRRAPSAWATWLGSSTFWSEDSVWPCWWPWLSSVTSPEPRPNEWRWQRMHRTLTQLPRRIHRILQLIRKVTTYMESKV